MPGFLHTLLFFPPEADVMSDTKQKAIQSLSSSLCIQRVLYGVILLTGESGEFFSDIRLFSETL